MKFDRVHRSLSRRRENLRKALRGWVPRQPRPVILMYHRIVEESFDPWGTAVSPAHFAGHLEWLSRNRTVLPLARFVELHRSRSLPNDAVAITFDDGYRCNVEVAAPLLDEFGIPATIFLPVEWIEKGKSYWWDELEEIVLTHEGESLFVDEQMFAIGQKSPADRRWKFGCGPRTARQAAFNVICRHLSSSHPNDVERVMRELRAQSGAHYQPAPSRRPMSVTDAGMLGRPLIEFGSHAVRHPWLPCLSAAEKDAEIRNSRERCWQITGELPAAFAYPFGQLDKEAEALVLDAGYLCAVSTEDAPVAETSRVSALPRVHVPDSSVAELKRRLRSL